MILEVEPNEDSDHALVVSAPAVAKGSVRLLGDPYDSWALQMDYGKTYRVWMSTRIDGSCPLDGQDGEIGVLIVGHAAHVREFHPDIDYPENRCAEVVVESLADALVYFDVTLWSATLDYYLWFEER